MTFNKDQDYWASANSTNEFLCIETYSGLGMTGVDHLFFPHLLPSDVAERKIGETIIQALRDSRTLTEQEADHGDFFDLEISKERYNARITMLMEKYGYKTKKALFNNMKHCIIHCVNGLITISPTRHEKLDRWFGISEEENVILPVTSTPEEIGAGLRLAFSRCY